MNDEIYTLIIIVQVFLKFHLQTFPHSYIIKSIIAVGDLYLSDIWLWDGEEGEAELFQEGDLDFLLHSSTETFSALGFLVLSVSLLFLSSADNLNKKIIKISTGNIDWF